MLVYWSHSLIIEKSQLTALQYKTSNNLEQRCHLMMHFRSTYVGIVFLPLCDHILSWDPETEIAQCWLCFQGQVSGDIKAPKLLLSMPYVQLLWAKAPRSKLLTLKASTSRLFKLVKFSQWTAHCLSCNFTSLLTVCSEGWSTDIEMKC